MSMELVKNTTLDTHDKKNKNTIQYNCLFIYLRYSYDLITWFFFWLFLMNLLNALSIIFVLT
jgi:hypothetical protein